MEGGRFLPPEPGGPEPDLGERRRASAPPPPTPPQARPPFAARQGYPRPGDPLGWGQAGRASGAPPGWGYPPPVPRAPDNGMAVTGFVFSVVAASLLVLSAGLSSILSVAGAITGIVCSRAGRRRVDRGLTPQHRSLAQAGFVIGIVTLVLSVLATAGWIALLVSDDSILNDGGSGSPSGSPSTMRTGAAAARALLVLAT